MFVFVFHEMFYDTSNTKWTFFHTFCPIAITLFLFFMVLKFRLLLKDIGIKSLNN